MREGAPLDLEAGQAHYLLTVLRMRAGDGLLVFNGCDGEWRAEIAEAARKACTLRLVAQTRPQPVPRQLTYAFAPLKSARLDYLVQKAVEMGATELKPVLTRRTQASKVNIARMEANIVEAAEQCGILDIAFVAPETSFDAFLAGRHSRPGTLVFCDEDAAIADPIAALRLARAGDRPVTVFIGPEGGFDPAERAALAALPDVIRLSLGPRILRADTAAVAALALVQSVLGDWRRGA